MLQNHVENPQAAARLAGAPQSLAARMLIRFVAFLVALLLLEVLLSCRGPDFTGTTLEKERLTTLKSFCIDSQPDPALYIWNMRPIPFEELKPLVSDRLVEKGYRLASSQDADFRITLTTFTEEPTPRYRVMVMELVERSTSRKLWSGRAEIPYRIDPIQGVAVHPALTGLLELIPPQTGAAGAAPPRRGSEAAMEAMDTDGFPKTLLRRLPRGRMASTWLPVKS